MGVIANSDSNACFVAISDATPYFVTSLRNISKIIINYFEPFILSKKNHAYSWVEKEERDLELRSVLKLDYTECYLSTYVIVTCGTDLPAEGPVPISRI